MDQVLRDFEVELAAHQPGLAEAFRPGMTAVGLEQAESEMGYPLHPELKALYRWHDGLNTNVELFPGYGFVSLEEAIRINREVNAAYARSGMGPLMAHEAAWLTLFPDPAGDGYYYDPAASYGSGGVFFNFRESGYYIHFPSIRNLLVALTECFRQGVYQGGQTLDFKAELRILTKYGRETRQ
jgi:cell wall assembly regulator SMI1